MIAVKMKRKTTVGGCKPAFAVGWTAVDLADPNGSVSLSTDKKTATVEDLAVNFEGGAYLLGMVTGNLCGKSVSWSVSNGFAGDGADHVTVEIRENAIIVTFWPQAITIPDSTFTGTLTATPSVGQAVGSTLTINV